MNSDLSPAAEAFLTETVSLGDFSTRNDALEAAVDLLRQRQQLVATLKESRRQLDEGEYLEFDETGLKHYFDQLKNRARQAAAGRQT